MLTRFRFGSNGPPERLNIHVSPILPLPKSYTDAYGTLSRYKARLVANGSTQLEGIDVDETFNAKNAFLHGDLFDTVYMHQPPGFWDYAHPNYACLLQRGLTLLIYYNMLMILFSLPLLRDVVISTQILRYVPGTLDHGLQLFSSSTTPLVTYLDAYWAGCPTTRRSTSGYCVFLGNNLLSWSSKRQPNLSRSSAETEYRGFANVAETC
ncbi:ribonuclease H-like domain-containing protein [Tanacetum coccineum]